MPSDASDVHVFARNYLEEMRDVTHEENEHWQTLDGWIDRDPEKAWTVLLELSNLADEQETGRLGAGPLEELLVAHPSFVYRAAELARTNDTFKSMLSCVATRDMMGDARLAIRSVLDG